MGVLQELAPLLQGLVFAGLELGPLNLLQLVLESLHPPQLFALVHGEAVFFLPQRDYLLVGPFIGLPRRGVLGKQVQIRKVLRLVKELLRVVLAVDVDQLSAQLFEDGHGDGPSVDAADVFAVAIDLPLHQKLARLIVHTVFLEPRKLRHIGEHGADESAVRPGANDVPVRPLAQDGRDGVDHDRFTGAGLAGQDVEAPVKGDLRLLDDGDIFDVE